MDPYEPDVNVYGYIWLCLLKRRIPYSMLLDVLCIVLTSVRYRNWYKYRGHKRSGKLTTPGGLVVNEKTMTEIEVSISILSWWN